MPRQDRGWNPITATISSEMRKLLKETADVWEVDPGTVIDVALWKMLDKPTSQEIARVFFEGEMVERVFVEEVLEICQEDRAVFLGELARQVKLDVSPSVNHRKIKSLVNQWNRCRVIDKDYYGVAIEAAYAVRDAPGGERGMSQAVHMMKMLLAKK